MTVHTTKIVTATDKSTRSLLAAVGGLSKIVTELGLFSETQAIVALEIETLEGQKAALEVALTETERTAKAELAIRILENEDAVLDELLAKRGLAHITTDALESLNTELSDAAATLEAGVAEAIKVTTATINNTHELEKLREDNSIAVLAATNTAEKAALTSQVSALKAQVLTLETTVNADREARVAVDTARANSPTAVTTTA